MVTASLSHNVAVLAERARAPCRAWPATAALSWPLWLDYVEPSLLPLAQRGGAALLHALTRRHPPRATPQSLPL